MVNGPFQDPVLYVDMRWQGSAVLFDLGRIDRLSPGHLLRLTHICVSHTHMDHFMGFDHGPPHPSAIGGQCRDPAPFGQQSEMIGRRDARPCVYFRVVPGTPNRAISETQEIVAIRKTAPL